MSAPHPHAFHTTPACPLTGGVYVPPLEPGWGLVAIPANGLWQE